MDHLFLCLVFLIFLRLFIAALWSTAGKELTSWLLLVMFIVFLLLSHVVSWVRCGIWYYYCLNFASVLTFTVYIFMFHFSKLSSMTTALCGIVLFCLLTIIHDDNIKTDASLIKKFKTMLKHRKEMVLARCCVKHCLQQDICKPKLGGQKGCRCFRRDKRYAGGGRWLFYP